MQAKFEESSIPFLDLNDDVIKANPFEAARAASEKSWVARIPHGMAVLSYDGWVALANDKRVVPPEGLALTAQGVESKIVLEWASKTLLGMQDEQHDRVRRLALPSFTAANAELFRSEARRLIEEIYSRVIPLGRGEVAELNNEFVTRVICKVIGYDDSRWRDISKWADDANLVVAMDVLDHIPRIEKSLIELREFTKEQVRCIDIDNDQNLAARLLREGQDSEKLSLDEVHSLLETVLMAGSETSTRMLSQGLYLYSKNPELWEQLKNNEDLASSSVEELLRYRTPFLGPTRIALEDIEINGVTINKGTTLVLCLPSANVDGHRFDKPDEFIIDRYKKITSKNSHLTFGFGPRLCLGRHIARIELQEAFKFLPRKIEKIKIDASDNLGVIWSSPLAMHGPIRLPLTWKTRD